MAFEHLLPLLTEAAPGTLPCWKAPLGAALAHPLLPLSALTPRRDGRSTVTLTVLPSAWSAVAISSRFWVAVVMWFVLYVAIVQGQRSGVNPKEQIRNCLDLIHTSTAPPVSSTHMWHTPDDAWLTECISKAISMIDVCRPLTTPLIEVCPGDGLNGEV